MLHRCSLLWRTAFVTDVEGDLLYFIRYAERSKVVAWVNGSIVFRDQTSHFVYGGDVFDRGDDITFARALLAFYDAHPSRVHLILGNRDINKMAFGGALFEKALGEPNLSPDTAQRLAFPFIFSSSSGSVRPPLYAEYLKLNGLPAITTKVTFIQWALSYKMGAAKAFEHRRSELQRIYEKAFISDDVVAESFFDAARPGGVYHEYLKRGRIVDVVDGVLFVHGGVVDENVGFVPGKQGFLCDRHIQGRNIMLECGEANMWFDTLNKLKEDSLRQWALTGDGMLLRQFALPATVVPHSVVVNSLVKIDGPRYLGLGAVEFLNRSGVVIVCSGHRPAGDIPSVVQQPGLLCLAADNSYCGDDGSRGQSVVEVLLEEDGSVFIHGLRANGTPYEFVVTGTPVGRHLGDGWWIRAIVGNGLYEAQRTRDAYQSKEVMVLTATDVEERLHQWHEPPVNGMTAQRWRRQQLSPVPRVVKVKRTPRKPDNNDDNCV